MIVKGNDKIEKDLLFPCFAGVSYQFECMEEGRINLCRKLNDI